jgi:hypothetical protein
VPEQRRAAGYAAWERRAERPMLVLALVFLVVLLVFCLLNMTPGQYRRWGKPSRAQYRLSLITWSGLVLNVVAAVIAYTTSTWVSKG